jgi:hypothetical protein
MSIKVCLWPSQINPIHILKSCFKIYFHIILPSLICGLFPSLLPNKFCILHLFDAYYMSHPSYLFQIVTLIPCIKEYKLQYSSNFLHSSIALFHVTLSKIFSCVSVTPTIMSFLSK